MRMWVSGRAMMDKRACNMPYAGIWLFIFVVIIVVIVIVVVVFSNDDKAQKSKQSGGRK